MPVRNLHFDMNATLADYHEFSHGYRANFYKLPPHTQERERERDATLEKSTQRTRNAIREQEIGGEV